VTPEGEEETRHTVSLPFATSGKAGMGKLSQTSVPDETATTEAQQPAGPWPVQLAAFSNRNYRILWAGALISNMGAWLHAVAQGWLVLELTHSAFMLGLVSFMNMLPMLVLSPVGGVAADRFDRRYILMATQTWMMVWTALLALLTWFQVIRVEYILVLVFLFGFGTALNAPAWQSYIKDVVGHEHLLNAIALNSVQFNLARMAGPAIAAIALPLIGTAGAFALNALSYGAITVALLLIPSRPSASRLASMSLLRDLREAWHYLRRDRVLSTLLLVATVHTIFGTPYLALLPMVVHDTLRSDASVLGLLTSATGIGAVLGAVWVAGLGDLRQPGLFLLIAEVAFGLALLVFGSTRTVPTAFAAMMALGIFMIVFFSLSNTLIQRGVPEALRGRVMGLWILASWGLGPFGSLQAGTVAQFTSASFALQLGGAVCALAALIVAWQVPELRRATSRPTVAGEEKRGPFSPDGSEG